MTTMNLFANRATSKLAVGVASDETILTLAAGTGAMFPMPAPGEYFRLVVQKGNTAHDKREYMKCTARTGDSLTVERGQEGTPATNFAIADEVTHVVTALTLQDLTQTVASLEQTVATAGITTIDDTPPANPRYADRWVKPSSMTEMVWVPNTGTPGVWINPADAGSTQFPLPIEKGGTGATTPEEARANLGIGGGGGTGSDAANLPDGTQAAPSLAFASEPALGMYRPDNGTIGLAAVNATTLLHQAGFSGLTDLSIYPRAAGTSQISLYSTPYVVEAARSANGSAFTIAINDANVVTFTSQAIGEGAKLPIEFDAPSFTFTEYMRAQGGVRVNKGSVDLSAVSFDGDTDTGMYSPADNVICFATNGVERLRIAANGIVTMPGYTPPGGGGGGGATSMPFGTEANPGWAFTNEAGTGFYRPTEYVIGFSLGGAEYMRLDPATGLNVQRIISAGQVIAGTVCRANSFQASGGNSSGIQCADGTAMAPSITFNSNLTNGIFYAGLNQIGISTAAAIRMLIQNTGVTIYQGLTVNGALSLSGAVAAPTYSANAGTVSAAGYQFTGVGANTGLYSTQAGSFSATTGGIEAMRWNSGITLAQTRFYVIDGTINSPGFGFSQESNSGLSRPSTGVVVMSTSGVERERWTPTGVQIIGDVSNTSGQFLSKGGVASSPGLSFAADTNTGIYNPGPDAMTFSAGGTAIMNVSLSGATVTGNMDISGNQFSSRSIVKGATSTAVVPAVTFDNDGNTGLYWESADVVGITCGGAKVATFSAAGLTVVGTITGTGTSAPFIIPIAVGDETTALAAGAAKVTFRMPKAMTLTAVRGSLTTAQTSGALLTFNVKENGVTVFSTKPTFDNAEKTTTTAATAPVLSDTALADDAEITIDIDQVGDGTAKGLKVYLIGN